MIRLEHIMISAVKLPAVDGMLLDTSDSPEDFFPPTSFNIAYGACLTYQGQGSKPRSQVEDSFLSQIK